MRDTKRVPILVAAAILGIVLAMSGMLLFGLADDPLGTDGLRAIAVHVAATTLGLLLLWKRPENRFGVIVLTTGVVFGAEVADLGVLHYAASGADLPITLVQFAFAAAWLLQPVIALMWVLTLTCFPDGRFPSPAWRRWVLVTTAIHVVVSVGAFLTAGRGDLPSTVAELPLTIMGPLGPTRVHAVLGLTEAALTFALPAIGLLALADRVRQSGPVVRQQAKWLLAAVFVFVVVQIAIPASPDPWTVNDATGQLLLLLSPAMAQLAVGIAVFRFHLWEIDTVVSKALLFGLLSAVVSAVVIAVALGAGLLVGGSRNTHVVEALVITLIVVTASSALRGRSEHLVRRLVYGDRPRGYSVLSGLDESLASARDISELVPRIVDAVRRGLAVPWARCCIFAEPGEDGDLRVVSVDDPTLDTDGVEGTIVLRAHVVAALRPPPVARLAASLPEDVAGSLARLFPERAAATAVLVAGDELVGLVVCGDRPGDPVAEADLELLSLVAIEAAAAVHTRRLEAELRERLVELERQADQLRRSRQRLVTAQDDERRRIERDLHDGAQQQLVALAAQIRRAAVDRAPAATLAALAEQAEEAVFTLQELARGIYPSVLVDQGVGAAIRTQAARIPMDVRVVVDPSLVAERSGPDVEAALYFVALEALANVQKHAPDARVTVDLRREGHTIVLEVRDTGPGFDHSVNGNGNGLQNMSDRIAAVGGRCAFGGGPGEGTCVVATVPVSTVTSATHAPLGVRR